MYHCVFVYQGVRARACMLVFGSFTDICCEGQVSGSMEPINGASTRTPLPAFICCTGTHSRTEWKH